MSRDAYNTCCACSACGRLGSPEDLTHTETETGDDALVCQWCQCPHCADGFGDDEPVRIEAGRVWHSGCYHEAMREADAALTALRLEHAIAHTRAAIVRVMGGGLV